MSLQFIICHDIVNIRIIKEVFIMSGRVPFATKIDSELKDKFQELSKTTRIPQSKLTDEAFEDLIKKYEMK